MSTRTDGDGRTGASLPGGLDAVAGVRVGHHTGEATGVTVVLPPDGTTGAGEIRGGAPASRETALLSPGRTVTRVDAVTLTGGSAFGLAAADGVMRFLAERGVGQPTPAGPVPIVPTLAIFDLVASGGAVPGADEGYEAALDADRGRPAASRRLGAGRSAGVGGWRGTDHQVPGGLGQAARRIDTLDTSATVAALAVVNAFGDVIDADGSVLAGSAAPAGTPPFPELPLDAVHDDLASRGAGLNTTLVVVATDAVLDASECFLVAQSAHHGLARSIHPSHTRFDGDAAIVLATGAVAAPIDHLRVVATEVTETAVRSAVVGDAAAEDSSIGDASHA